MRKTTPLLVLAAALVIVGASAFTLDALTWGILTVLASPLGISREALNATWGIVGSET